METMKQSGSGPSTESEEQESRKSLAELKNLWEGMASRKDRPSNPEVQRKPPLVRQDKPRQTEPAGASMTSLLATVPGSMKMPTSSVATATISLVTPSSSTTKVKCSVTAPATSMATAQSFTSTAPGSMTSAIPMKKQTNSIATATSNFRTTQVNFVAKPPSSMTTPVGSTTMQASSNATSAHSMSTAPSPMTTYAISVTTPARSTTTAASLTTTTSSISDSGVLKNGKNSLRSDMTSQGPGKGHGQFESQDEASGIDQMPLNKETPIKAVPTVASTISPEATLNFVVPPGDSDSNPSRVVHGSILVRNSIDMIGLPRLLDVVENSDSDEGIVMEENTNLFHGRYFQLRENPLYFSDYEEDAEVQDGEDWSKARGKKARGGKDLRSSNGGPEGKVGTTPNVERLQNTRPLLGQTQREKDITSSNDDVSSSRRSTPFAADRCVKVDGANRSEILHLVDDDSDGARQTVTVERTEEVLTTEMMETLQTSGDPSKGVTNVDVVEERLDVELSNGQARVKVIIHCERIVPNRCNQSYMKSSVTVTRMTEVDMLATPERRRIYERVLDRYGGSEVTSHQTALVPRRRMRTDDVYSLYRVFMEIIGGSGSLAEDPGNQMTNVLSKTEVAGLELLRKQSFPLNLLRLGPLVSPVSSVQ